MCSFEQSVKQETTPYLNLSDNMPINLYIQTSWDTNKKHGFFQISVDENVPFICTNGVFISFSLSLQSAIADLQWGMPVH